MRLIAVGAVAGLIPDIDQDQSKLGRFNPLSGLMSHRGFAHSIVFALLVSLIAYEITSAAGWRKEIPFCIFLGMISHIAMDMFNNKGVQVFWPVKKRFLWPIHGIHTGSIADLTLCFILTEATIYFHDAGVTLINIKRFIP